MPYVFHMPQPDFFGQMGAGVGNPTTSAVLDQEYSELQPAVASTTQAIAYFVFKAYPLHLG